MFLVSTNRRCDRFRSGDAYWVLSQLPLCRADQGRGLPSNDYAPHPALSFQSADGRNGREWRGAENTPVSEVGQYRFTVGEITKTLMQDYSAFAQPKLAVAE